jgi:hypothetical protein
MEYAGRLVPKGQQQAQVSTLGTRPMIPNRPERAADWESAEAQHYFDARYVWDILSVGELFQDACFQPKEHWNSRPLLEVILVGFVRNRLT